jgi:hypothetical protein
MKRTAFLLTLLALCGAADLHAQTDGYLDIPDVLARLRSGSYTSAPAMVLRQEFRRRPIEELDAFADSLVAIATSYRPGDSLAALRAAGNSVGALRASANRESLAERSVQLAERGLPPPIPYPHAFEALEWIYHGTPEVGGVRGAVLSAMQRLPDSAQVVSFLKQVLLSPIAHGSAIHALNYLRDDFGEQGVALLRRLYETRAPVNPVAGEYLEHLATVRGWSR